MLPSITAHGRLGLQKAHASSDSHLCRWLPSSFTHESRGLHATSRASNQLSGSSPCLGPRQSVRVATNAFQDCDETNRHLLPSVQVPPVWRLACFSEDGASYPLSGTGGVDQARQPSRHCWVHFWVDHARARVLHDYRTRFPNILSRATLWHNDQFGLRALHPQSGAVVSVRLTLFFFGAIRLPPPLLPFVSILCERWPERIHLHGSHVVFSLLH